MKLVTLMPVIDSEKCKGCKTCVRVGLICNLGQVIGIGQTDALAEGGRG